jgi:hypothetical protein
LLGSTRFGVPLVDSGGSHGSSTVGTVITLPYDAGLGWNFSDWKSSYKEDGRTRE